LRLPHEKRMTDERLLLFEPQWRISHTASGRMRGEFPERENGY
jgi:hypothetical protein